MKNQLALFLGIFLAFSLVMAVNPVSAANYPINIDSYIFDGPADDGIYYAINAQQTSKDTILIALDCYSDEGVLGYSGTTTIQEINRDTLLITDVWGSPYNSYYQQEVTTKLNLKQYYFKEWKPNLFR